MRTFGVEEELLLVDERTGRPLPVAQQVLQADEQAGRRGGGALAAEMHREMIETITRPHASTRLLAEDVIGGRRAADDAARRFGARAAALATSPLAVTPHPTPSRRYTAMMGTYGAAAKRSLACGLHVHVSVESPDEGVAVLDRIRVWLPVLVALTANSPFADGEDTGHASWRTMSWNQWPSAGPSDVFGSLDAYRAHERRLLGTGVLLDAAMLYSAARISRAHPTVEIRVADVCQDPAVTVLVAALTRALVDTAADEWRQGVPPPEVPTAVLRLATWQAALTGVRGPLVDPGTERSLPAATVLGRLLAHLLPALERNGDDTLVVDALAMVLEEGTGADRQRLALGTSGSLAGVVAAAVAATHASTAPVPAAGWSTPLDLRAS